MIVSSHTDLAVVGSGFGGSLLAMIARRLGYRVMLLERGRHPRFAIGESASPLAGVLIEQLADRYDLPRVRPLSAFGTWQRAYPDVVCGLKRGFTYFKHERGERYRVANRTALRFLRRLERTHVAHRRFGELRRELHEFFRSGQEEKLRLAQ